jgi:hypothetical protein
VSYFTDASRAAQVVDAGRVAGLEEELLVLRKERAALQGAPTPPAAAPCENVSVLSGLAKLSLLALECRPPAR